jgi:hypothetical protein
MREEIVRFPRSLPASELADDAAFGSSIHEKSEVILFAAQQPPSKA